MNPLLAPVAGLAIATNMFGTNQTVAFWSKSASSGELGRPLVIYLHGNGGGANGWQFDLLINPNKTNIAAHLANAGCVVVSPQADGNAWGADPSYAEATNAYHWATNRFAPSSVTLMGNSMGGLLTLRCLTNQWASHAYLIEPVCSLSNMLGGQFTKQIHSRFETDGTPAGFARKASSFDPMNMVPELLAGKTLLIRASDGDKVVPKGRHTDPFQQRFGRSASITVMKAEGDHGHASHFQPDEVVRFVQRQIPEPVSP